MLIGLIVVAVIVVLMAMMLMNKNGDVQDREGIVNSVLSKDSLSVDFGDGKNSVVRFFGLNFAHESEMQDENIDAFLQGHVLGSRLRFKTKEVANGGVIVAEIYTPAEEYINEVLIRQGLARWSPGEAGSDASLMKAQEEAKTLQAGVWNPAIQELMKGKTAQSEEEEFEMGEEPKSEY